MNLPKLLFVPFFMDLTKIIPPPPTLPFLSLLLPTSLHPSPRSLQVNLSLYYVCICLFFCFVLSKNWVLRCNINELGESFKKQTKRKKIILRDI